MQLKNTNGSTKEVICALREKFEQDWAVGVPYTMNRLQTMTSQPLLLPLALKRITHYISEMGKHFYTSAPSSAPSKAIEEINAWEQAGGYCMFASILAKAMLDKLDPKNGELLNYYQGFSVLRTENAFVKMIFGEKQVGLHSWLTYKGGVLDLTSAQHHHSIQFPEHPLNIVQGAFPNSYELHGFKETKDVVHAYMKRFSEARQMTEDEWVTWHLEAMGQMK